MLEKTWNTWIDNLNWILTIAKNNHWHYQQLEIEKTVQALQIESLESNLKISYPLEFKDILMNYSSGVKFGWQITTKETPDEFRRIFCGCGGVSDYKTKPNLWDFHSLAKIYETYQGWLTNCYNDPTDEYGKHYYDKVPFIEVPNGDLIVFDSMGQVVYLSHDDGPLHGARLADNFIEFITLWSNVGCVGTESEQLEVFYDEEKQKLMNSNSKIDRWKHWLSNP